MPNETKKQEDVRQELCASVSLTDTQIADAIFSYLQGKAVIPDDAHSPTFEEQNEIYVLDYLIPLELN